MKRLLLSVSLLASSAYADFVRNDKEHVVTDNAMQIMWQDNEEVSTVKRNWEKALSYCEASELAGYTDWRLPKKQELLSIVDRKQEGAKIDEEFKNSSSFVYWSSSKPKSALPLAWRVDFDDGRAHWGAQKFAFLVRCVRDIK